MKVVLISYFYPNITYSGASLYAFNLAKALSRYAEVTVVMANVNREGLKVSQPGAKLCRVSLADFPLLRSPTFMLFASIKARQQGFDIIHSNCGWGAFCNFISVETFHHRADRLVKKIQALPQHLSLRRAAQVIAVSQRAKQELLEMGIGEEKITVVENGVDTDAFSYREYDPERLRDSLQLPTGKLILNVNTELSPRKNLPLMLNTLRYLKSESPDVKLIMIGPRAQKSFALDRVRSAGLEDFFYYFHDVPPDVMPEYYRAAEFLAVPSVKEGFGFPLLESIAVGKPFVSMDVGIAPLLSGLQFGWGANDEKGFMEKSAEMLSKPLKFGARGHAFVQETYSWDGCAKKTMAVYEKAERSKA